jgi:hypothetical protein
MHFGETVLFTHVYKRMRSHRQDGQSPNFIKIREWVPFHLRTPKKGVVIGKRTLFNGDVRYEYDDGWMFESTSSLQAYLIATDMKHKPVLVPIDSATSFIPF